MPRAYAVTRRQTPGQALRATDLEIRPVFHWTEGRVRSHVLVCFLALALESALERRLRELAPDLAYTQVRHVGRRVK